MPVIILSSDFTGGIKGTSQGAATVTGSPTVNWRGDGSAAGVASVFGTAFDPTTVTGLKIWTAARLFNNQVDGNSIQTWPDKSGNANDLAQATAGSRPLYKQNVVGGQPALLFDATDDHFTIPNVLTGLTAAEVFIVLQKIADPASTQAKAGFWNIDNATASSTGCHCPYTDGNIYDCFGSTTRKTVGNPTPSLASPALYNVSSAAGAWTARVNGTQVFTTGTNTVGFDTTPYLGRTIGPPASDSFFDGYIAEFLIYDNVLSSGNRTYVQDNLKSIYGIP